MTRVKDPLRADLFARLGVHTFSPTKVGIGLAHGAIFEAPSDVPPDVDADRQASPRREGA